MRQRLEIRTLGSFEVVRDGEPASLPASRKTRALLAYLAVTARAHRRERLCELFWEIPDDPRGSLRWSLTKIRPLVDDAQTRRVVATRENVRFDRHGARVDVLELRDAFKDDPDGLTSIQLTDLAGQFRGEFLDGVDLPSCPGFQNWLVAEREAVRALRRRVLATLIEVCGDDAETALAHARALVEVDPRDETAQIQLLRLLARTGRVREAHEQQQIAMRLLEHSDSSAASRLALALRDIDARRAQRVPESTLPEPAMPDAAPRQEIRFCTTQDGVRIAYATSGTGAPLAKAANWLSHLEHDWRSPIWRHLMGLLSENHALVRYDERGNGLSDLEVDDISFEAFVADLEAVIDASGIDRFPLVGISQGCAVAIAVRHPARVTRLILYGGYALGWKKRGNRDEIIAREALLNLIRIGWGQPNPAFRQVFTSLFFPDATPEQVDWFNELQRTCTTPENAVRLLRAMGEIDVSGMLGSVHVPTLVMHCTGDARVPFEQGRSLAMGIPGARFVQLQSRNHLVLEHEPAWARFAAEVRAFLAAGTDPLPRAHGDRG
jgi:DNA-binding SARP family transcriptional activator/pimeloyl-ACP methyl ester carboxylesterase